MLHATAVESPVDEAAPHLLRLPAVESPVDEAAPQLLRTTNENSPMHHPDPHLLRPTAVKQTVAAEVLYSVQSPNFEVMVVEVLTVMHLTDHHSI